MLILCACGRDRAENTDAPPIATPDALPSTITTASSTETTVTTETTATTSTTAPAAPQVNGPKLTPVDDAKKDPSLAAFRDDLLAAVRRHDVDAVVAAADPKIRTSFGAGGGVEVLRQMLQRPETWADLEQILSLGGTFVAGSREAFFAPYVYSAWPESHDAFTALAVIAENVPLKESPTGPAIATLAYDVVDRVGDPHDGWQKIKLSDGRTGFVETKFIRSPIGYRAGFNKTGKNWRMTALVAGD